MKRKRVIICPDSFKGSIDSITASGEIAKGVKNVFPNADIDLMPVGDGGEGTLEIWKSLRGWKSEKIACHDLRMRNTMTEVLVSDDFKEVYIESAKIVGLDLCKPDERDIMTSTTFGLGEVISEMAERGAEKFFIGLGGSGTNDYGLGMLNRLGVRFRDKEGKVLEGLPLNLNKIAEIEVSEEFYKYKKLRFNILSDVSNGLYGPGGAAVVYGPQKGATKKDISFLEAGIIRLVEIIEKNSLGSGEAFVPGVGAAGGLGYAFKTFLGGTFESGITKVLNLYGFKEKVRDTFLIITGEGSIDSQSLMGKATGEIMRLGKASGCCVAALAGRVGDKDRLMTAGFDEIIEISDPDLSPEQNMEQEKAALNLFEKTEILCRKLREETD